MSNYNNLIITFNKWSAPRVRARVSQIVFGIIRVFGKKEMVEFSVLRQIDPSNMNVQASELRYAFDNRDGKFNFENPSGIFNFITARMKVLPRIGFKGELVPLGVYYLSDWNADQSTGKAANQALDALSLLDVTFAPATYTNQTLATIAQAAFTQAGFTGYSLDNSLSGITVTAYINNKTCRQVLADVATAACLTLYVNLNGAVVIGVLSSTASGYTLSYKNSKKPVGAMDKPLKSVIVKYGTTTDGSGNSIDAVVSGSYNATGREIAIKDNPFITTSARATAVRDWLAIYYQRRKNYQNDWRQNPSIDVADIIGVQTDFGAPNAQVLSQQLSVSAGGVSGQTKSKGV